MDWGTHRKTINMIRQLLDFKTSTLPLVETCPQKPPCRLEPADQPLPRTSPEAQGIAAAYLTGFLSALEEDASLDPHGVMVLRNGAVIAERAYGAYDQRLWHITHSECKSITGLAIGMLIDEMLLSLDDKVYPLFEKHHGKLAKLTQKNLTIRHLLTMTSGVIFNEAGAVTETDWVRCFLDSVVMTEPGRQFNYNSMNTYMLSAIVRQVSGQGLMDYLRPRLWEPLGISGIFWETCPKGIEKGGWGLYIRPEDMAKIGQLVLQKGQWQGRRIVSEQWIAAATSVQAQTPETLGGFDYGYQIWVARKHNAFLFNGMFGQNVLGFPDSGILVVSNAGNNELFQQSNYFRLVEHYFFRDFPPQAAPPEPPDGASCGLSRRETGIRPGHGPDVRLAGLDELCAGLDGKTYLADQTAAAAVGLLPLLTQVIQNNYAKGLKSLSFKCSGGEFFVAVNEADETHLLPVGFGSPRQTDLSCHGEPYKVAVAGQFAISEDGQLVLKLRVSFLEIANSRLLKIYFSGDTILTQWTESPGRAYLSSAMAAIRSEVKDRYLINSVVTKADSDFFRFKIKNMIEPEVTARLAAAQEDTGV